MNDFFINYEIKKLDIIHPDLVNLFILLLFLTVTFISFRKTVIVETCDNFLSVSHTDQLKGIGIFFVVLGHLWVHVSSTKPLIVLSGEAVSLFLLLSGFGLARSCRKRIYSFKDFFTKRINRVMLPYWIVTTLILITDYFLLGRSLQGKNLIMTYIGINLNSELFNLDFVRWFVTFILAWYLLFYLMFEFVKSDIQKVIFLFCAAAILLPLDYYIFHFGWYQFFAFPAGCFLALFYKKLVLYFKTNENIINMLLFIGILYLLSFKLLMSVESVNLTITSVIPNILLAYIFDLNSLAFCILLIIISSKIIKTGLTSRFLLFLGRYSYEIFLLHGALLVKYNPVIKSQNTLAITIQFYILFIIVILISVLCNKSYNRLNSKIPS